MPAFSVQTERNVDEDQATRSVDDAEIQSTGDSVERSTEFVKRLVPNPLESYASVNFLWTLSCLTKSQFNDPLTYRDELIPTNIVFSSAGRFDDQRVQTFEGTPEFFIENFRMKTVIAPNPKAGSTNAVMVEFDVYEPYSMGLFFQSLQNAARQAGFINYLSAPFLLRLDFIGFNDLGQKLSPGDSPFVKPKFFVIKLTSASFTVDAGGSRYQVAGVPYNHDAYSDSMTTLYNDITIRADDGTVDSLLNTGENSLAAALNRVEQQMVEAGKICIPDVYKIEFPRSSDEREFAPQNTDDNESATQDLDSVAEKVIGGKDFDLFEPNTEINTIGQSGFNFTAATGGSHPFLDEAESLNEDGELVRENVTIDPTTREFRFGQGQSIMKIIEQCIMDSDFVVNALKPENKREGRILYYKIDVQVELLDFDVLIGDFAKKIIFRVVPYLVHESVFAGPRALPAGYDQIQKTVVKGYNYIYSGQNVDLLRFDIRIDNLFYVGMNPTPEVNNATQTNPDLQGIEEEEVTATETSSGDSDVALLSNTGRRRIAKDPSLLQTSAGGTGTTSTQQQIAESFHKAFINGSSGDLISINIEVMGDPFWILDSGMANYHATPTGFGSQVTEDGTANYEGGEVYVYLSFITPADVNEVTGLYKYPVVGKESPFSGIYRVTLCENTFTGGDFRQTLECVRMPGQSIDFDRLEESDRPQLDDRDGDNSASVREGEVQPPRVSPNDRPTPQSFCQVEDSEDAEED